MQSCVRAQRSEHASFGRDKLEVRDPSYATNAACINGTPNTFYCTCVNMHPSRYPDHIRNVVGRSFVELPQGHSTPCTHKGARMHAHAHTHTHTLTPQKLTNQATNEPTAYFSHSSTCLHSCMMKPLISYPASDSGSCLLNSFFLYKVHQRLLKIDLPT